MSSVVPLDEKGKVQISDSSIVTVNGGSISVTSGSILIDNDTIYLSSYLDSPSAASGTNIDVTDIDSGTFFIKTTDNPAASAASATLTLLYYDGETWFTKTASAITADCMWHLTSLSGLPEVNTIRMSAAGVLGNFKISFRGISL